MASPWTSLTRVGLSSLRGPITLLPDNSCIIIAHYFKCPLFELFSVLKNLKISPAVDVKGGDIPEAFMIALVIVVPDKGASGL